jgi:hypothetical protein
MTKTTVVARFGSYLAVVPMLLTAQPLRDNVPSDTGLLRCIGNRITPWPSWGLLPQHPPTQILSLSSP